MSETAVVLYCIFGVNWGGGSADAARSNKQGWEPPFSYQDLTTTTPTHKDQEQQRQRRCAVATKSKLS